MPPPALHANAPMPAVVAPAPHPSPRGELVARFEDGLGASTWSGDFVSFAGLSFGLRLWRVVTPFVGATLGYGRVDQRLLTRLTMGVELGHTFARRFRPHLSAAFVHQHEESIAAVAQEPLGAVFGIGQGIRHRAGVALGGGLTVRVYQSERFEFGVGPDLGAMYLTYSTGPDWYFYGGVGLTGALRLW